MRSLLKIVVVLVMIYLVIALLSPPLANQITNFITFNWDALDWSRVYNKN